VEAEAFFGTVELKAVPMRSSALVLRAFVDLTLLVLRDTSLPPLLSQSELQPPQEVSGQSSRTRLGTVVAVNVAVEPDFGCKFPV